MAARRLSGGRDVAVLFTEALTAGHLHPDFHVAPVTSTAKSASASQVILKGKRQTYPAVRADTSRRYIRARAHTQK